MLNGSLGERVPNIRICVDTGSPELAWAAIQIGGYARVLSDSPITQRNTVDRHNLESTFGPVRCDWSPEASVCLWSGFLSRQHPASAPHTGRSWRAKCGIMWVINRSPSPFGRHNA